MIAFSELASLKFFNEKAEKLLKSRFVEHLQEIGKLSVTISANKGQEVQVTRILPDQHAIDEFVLTLRFFIQDNEKSSFRQISQVYRELSLSPELKKNFLDCRKALNNYLDQKTNMTIHAMNPSRRELLNIFIYGDLAHAILKRKPSMMSGRKWGLSIRF